MRWYLVFNHAAALLFVVLMLGMIVAVGFIALRNTNKQVLVAEKACAFEGKYDTFNCSIMEDACMFAYFDAVQRW